MRLAEYISKTGTHEFAKRFEVSESAVISWMYGYRQPRVRIAMEIMRRVPSLKLTDIYQPIPRRKRKK